ncbi:hypothetical protein BDR06DRAFT_682601 [Suillus hirtellus]|nr:hypothetical protein BDR06DRAFT_682601 [Suillus hirtellus]
MPRTRQPEIYHEPTSPGFDVIKYHPTAVFATLEKLNFNSDLSWKVSRGVLIKDFMPRLMEAVDSKATYTCEISHVTIQFACIHLLICFTYTSDQR